MDAIRSRRSVRNYRPDRVPRDVIERLLEAATWAPSAHNKQPWKFAVISEDAALRGKVAALSKYGEWISKAPCLILVYLDKSSLDERIYNCAAKHHEAIGSAIQNLMLAAGEEGLGTCWIGEIARAAAPLGELLGTAQRLEFVALLTVGYPDGEPGQGRREPPGSAIVSWS